jgi:hypothetical protein
MELNPILLGQSINHQETQIMPRSLVLVAGIAKAYDQLHRSIPARPDPATD